MVILYVYLRDNNSIITCIPFRYNIDDENNIDSREIILDVDTEVVTKDSIKQQVLNMLDKEKQEDGKLTTGLTDSMSVITIE